jgi:hypothetical protein
MLVAGLQSPAMKIEIEVTARLRRDEITARLRRDEITARLRRDEITARLRRDITARPGRSS